MTDEELAATILKMIKQQRAKETEPEVQVAEVADYSHDDELFEGETIWNPDPVWNTIGLVAGAVGLVAVGAVVGYLLAK